MIILILLTLIFIIYVQYKKHQNMLIKKITPKRIKKIFHYMKFYWEKIYFSIFYNVRSFVKKRASGYTSQYGQDYYIDKFIMPKLESFDGTIVEIGCNDPIYNNNSYYFSKNNNVLSIDPLDYSLEYEKRENTKFINCAISDKKGFWDYYKVKKKEGWEDQMSGFEKPENHFEYDVVKVPTNTLNNILTENNIVKISILFLDCEGYEYKILSSSNFERFKPDLIVAENNIFGNKLRHLLKEKGYSFRYRFWTADDVYVRNAYQN